MSAADYDRVRSWFESVPDIGIQSFIREWAVIVTFESASDALAFRLAVSPSWKVVDVWTLAVWEADIPGFDQDVMISEATARAEQIGALDHCEIAHGAEASFGFRDANAMAAFEAFCRE